MEENPNKGKLLALAMTLPFVISVPPLIGWWLGSHLDDFFQTKPFILYGFLALGVLAAGRETYRIIKRIREEIENA